MHQEHRAFERRRRREARLEREQQVVLRLVEVGVEDAVLVRADLVEVAVRAHREAVVIAIQCRRRGSAAGDSTSPRGRSSAPGTAPTERPPEMPKPFSSIFVRQRLDFGVDRVRIARRAPRLVDRHLEGVVLVQQRERAGRQLVLVLRGIRLRDRELRLVARRTDRRSPWPPSSPRAVRTSRRSRPGSCRPCCRPSRHPSASGPRRGAQRCASRRSWPCAGSANPARLDAAIAQASILFIVFIWSISWIRRSR